MAEDDNLIAAFDALMASAPSEPGVTHAVATARRAMGGTPRRPDPEPLIDPLADALSRHSRAETKVGRLLAAVESIATELVWAVAYDNHHEPDMQRVRAGYRYAPIVGPEPAARHPDDEVAVFVTIQGPDLVYPPHAHKAPELYVVLGGSGQWQIGDGPFERRVPGDWVWHPTGTRHAMRTGDEAMTALAIWTTDPTSPSVIVRG